MPVSTTTALSDLEQMRHDAILPADIAPTAAPGAARPLAGTVLLTGATGFVGAHLLHVLLRETTARICCLVRPGRGRLSAHDRLQQALAVQPGWEPAWTSRIEMVPGDLTAACLGLGEHEHEQLASRVDLIVHGAAAVNWVKPYARLRHTNVLGTREVLRLACRGRPKHLHFLSSISVCYATAAAATLTEADDPWPLLDQLHFGYAQSKAVAEQLVRQAAARGLPAVIYRPALITGDSRTGAANPHDFLARGIGACVQMGCAPDVDWLIDACPVDHVAQVMVRRAADPRPAPTVLHLLHPEPRHWRELLLWMRLNGYPLQLVSYRDWLRRLERAARTRMHPLFALRGFFRARVGDVSLPETYLGGRRTGVCAVLSSRALAQLDLPCPVLDARWLERFFHSLAGHALLPPLPPRPLPASARCWSERLPALLRDGEGEPALQVETVGPARRLAQQSILTELASWRRGAAAGLFRQTLRLTQAQGPSTLLDVVVKVKLEDSHLLDVAEAAAALCDERVGAAFARWRSRLGLAGGFEREKALYRHSDERWRRHVPRCHGAAWHADDRCGLLVLEDLSPGAWFDPCSATTAWQPAQIEAAITGLAQLHAAWLDRPAELLAQPWLGPVLTAADMAEMSDLWRALARFAARYFALWLGPDIRRVQRRLLSCLQRWWQPLQQLPRTLSHNDFNPRNLALRPGPVLCAYDWELATCAIPQHDLAQFLCFVLPEDCSRSTVASCLELHRRALEEASGCRLDADTWRLGFAAALADLLVNRLAMYTLVHTIRRQPFLERVLRTWRTLFAYHSDPCGVP